MTTTTDAIKALNDLVEANPMPSLWEAGAIMAPEVFRQLRRKGLVPADLKVQPDLKAWLDTADQLEDEKAVSAELRQRLQRAQGALSAFVDPASKKKPVSEWEWAPTPAAYDELRSTTTCGSLLEGTRPDTVNGLSLLMQLRELTEENVALRRRLAEGGNAS